MTYEKVNPGQKGRGRTDNRADFINDTIDVVNAWKRGLLGNRTASRRGGNGPLQVQNLTGDDRDKGAVVQLGAYLLDEIDPDNLWFEGNEVSEPVTSKLAILLNPLPEDEIGPVAISGVCVARVNVVDESHGYAAAEAGSYVLKSASSGPIEILSPPDGTGEQEMAVRLGASAGGVTRRVIANESIAAEGGTGSVTVLEPGEEEPAEDAETFSDCVNDTSQELNEGDFAYLLPGDTYLLPTRCPT